MIVYCPVPLLIIMTINMYTGHCGDICYIQRHLQRYAYVKSKMCEEKTTAFVGGKPR